MKKILALVLTTVIAGSASLFALGNSLDVSFAMPMLSQATKINADVTSDNYIHTTTTAFSNGFGFDVADTVKLSKFVGVKFDAGFWFPSTCKTTTTVTTAILGKVKTVKSDPITSDYKDLFVFNGFVGASLSPFANNKGLSLYIIPGFDFNIATQKINDSKSITAVHTGVGLDLNASVALIKHWYVIAGCPFVYYFSEKVGDNTNDNFKGSFGFTPRIGLGYRM